MGAGHRQHLEPHDSRDAIADARACGGLAGPGADYDQALHDGIRTLMRTMQGGQNRFEYFASDLFSAADCSHFDGIIVDKLTGEYGGVDFTKATVMDRRGGITAQLAKIEGNAHSSSAGQKEIFTDMHMNSIILAQRNWFTGPDSNGRRQLNPTGQAALKKELIRIVNETTPWFNLKDHPPPSLSRPSDPNAIPGMIKQYQARLAASADPRIRDFGRSLEGSVKLAQGMAPKLIAVRNAAKEAEARQVYKGTDEYKAARSQFQTQVDIASKRIIDQLVNAAVRDTGVSRVNRTSHDVSVDGNTLTLTVKATKDDFKATFDEKAMIEYLKQRVGEENKKVMNTRGGGLVLARLDQLMRDWTKPYRAAMEMQTYFRDQVPKVFLGENYVTSRIGAGPQPNRDAQPLAGDRGRKESPTRTEGLNPETVEWLGGLTPQEIEQLGSFQGRTHPFIADILETYDPGLFQQYVSDANRLADVVKINQLALAAARTHQVPPVATSPAAAADTVAVPAAAADTVAVPAAPAIPGPTVAGPAASDTAAAGPAPTSTDSGAGAPAIADTTAGAISIPVPVVSDTTTDSAASVPSTRSRGRRSTRSTPADSTTPPPSARSRGRAAAAPASDTSSDKPATSGRPRGRAAAPPASDTSSDKPATSARPRGRASTPPASDTPSDKPTTSARPRGRASTPPASDTPSDKPTTSARPRGRASTPPASDTPSGKPATPARSRGRSSAPLASDTTSDKPATPARSRGRSSAPLASDTTSDKPATPARPRGRASTPPASDTTSDKPATSARSRGRGSAPPVSDATSDKPTTAARSRGRASAPPASDTTSDKPTTPVRSRGRASAPPASDTTSDKPATPARSRGRASAPPASDTTSDKPATPARSRGRSSTRPPKASDSGSDKPDTPTS